MKSSSQPAANRSMILVAFLVVYLVWGSTYLGIRYAIETLPALLMAGSRFVIAGGLLYGITKLRVRERPTGRQWCHAMGIGVLLFAGGNGLVCLSQRAVPSGLASLFIATTPIWIVGLESIFILRAWPPWRVMAGLVVGLFGLSILVNPAAGASQPVPWLGAAGLLAACFCWSLGSLLSRQVNLPKSLFLTAGMQMLGGGGALLLWGALAGEWSAFDITSISGRSLAAYAYLILFGSILALTAYTYLLRVCAAASVATYAYVNPIVAVILGITWGGEEFSWRMAFAAGLILLAVALILTRRRSRSPQAHSAEAERAASSSGALSAAEIRRMRSQDSSTLVDPAPLSPPESQRVISA